MHRSMAKAGKSGQESSQWGAICFLSSFVVYAFTASPVIGWLDSPEFIAQACELGVAHSPGHPLPPQLGYLASLIPVGDVVWRINLMSSLCAATAIYFLYRTGYWLLAENFSRLSKRSCHALSGSLALLLAFSWALWSNAVRAEVYALQALLTTASLYSLAKFSQSRRLADLLCLCFVLGFGLANHHFMALLIFVPGLVYVFASGYRPKLREILICASGGLLALLSLVYLPLRSLAHPLVNFGAPHTLERFWWTLSGAAFSKSAQKEHVSTPIVDAVQELVALSNALSLPILLLAIFAIGLVLRKEKSFGFGITLVGIALITIVGRVLLGFDPETPDHHAYLLPAIFSMALLALFALGQLCMWAASAQTPIKQAPLFTFLAVFLLVPIQLATSAPQASQRDARASDDVAHWELSELPPHSLLLLAYFQSSFRLWSLQVVEGARPDLMILDRSFLSYPGMSEEAKLRFPQLASIIDSPLKAGYPTPISAIEKTGLPTYVQLHPNVDANLTSSLALAGPFARLARNESPAKMIESDRRGRAQLKVIYQGAGKAEKFEAKGALLWHDATRLDHACRRHWREQALEIFKEARALAPEDQMLAEMGIACRLSQPK